MRFLINSAKVVTYKRLCPNIARKGDVGVVPQTMKTFSYGNIKKSRNISEKDDSCFRSPSHLPRPSLDDEISIDAACSNPNVNNTEEFTGRQ